jgi:phosphoglycerate dehydrogenase-like enzyme
LVDEDALFDALAAGTIAGAGLDVHRLEPRQARDRFAALPNVVMTPHIAGGSRLGVLQEATAIFANMRAALAGEPPLHGRVLP